MKVKKIKKIIVIVLCILTILINLKILLLNGGIINFLNLISLAPVLLTLYNNSDFLYLKVNKFLFYFRNKTINFEPEIKFIVDEGLGKLSDVEKNVDIYLDENRFSLMQNGVTKTDCTIDKSIISENQLISKITISVGNDGIHDYFKVKWNFQISFRDLSNNWKNFKNLRECLLKKFNSDSVVNSVLIKTSESNTSLFYKLTIKKFDNLIVKSADLEVNNDEITINIGKNSLYAHSEKIDEIEDVVKNFIPLTNVY